MVFDIDGTVLVDVNTPEDPIRPNVVEVFNFIKRHGIKFAFNTARIDVPESRAAVNRFVSRLVGWSVPDSLVRMRPQTVMIKDIPECKVDNMGHVCEFFKSTKAETVLFDDNLENLEEVGAAGYLTCSVSPISGVCLSDVFDAIFNKVM